MRNKIGLLVLVVFSVILVGVLIYALGQEKGENNEKFKRTTAEERLAELLSEPIKKEEYTGEEEKKEQGYETDISLVDIEKEQVKIITERVSYIKEGKVNLWVTLGNIDNVEMRSYTGDKLINGLRYKAEYIETNLVNDLLQVENVADLDNADNVSLILDNTNLYIKYAVHEEQKAKEINSEYKAVSKSGLKVDLMLEYTMGYKGKADTKGVKYINELNLVSNAKEKQEYKIKVYTKSKVKSNGLGTLLYDKGKILNNRENYELKLQDIFKSTAYEPNNLVWVLDVTSAKDTYNVEETELDITIKK